MMAEFMRSLSISPSAMAVNEESPEASRPSKTIRVSSQQDSIMGSLFHSPTLNPIVRLVGELLNCESLGYELSLDSAVDDLYVLLLKPSRFLFEPTFQLQPTTQIYGRASEARELLDAFHRVASRVTVKHSLLRGLVGKCDPCHT